MSTYGRSAVASVGKSIRLSADGEPLVKHGGVTIDWGCVAVAAADAVLFDSTQIYAGEKYLRYGQVIAVITTPALDVATLNNTPTGGTFALSVTAGGTTTTTTALAFNASAATVQTAVRALANVGGTLATVTGSAGGPYTVAFNNSLGAVTLTGDGALLTGAGAQPTVTISQSASGGDVGKYGPYDPAALDGRQTLTYGQCYLIHQTVKENDLHSDHPEVLYGGLLWKDRIIQSGTATHTLAAGPTLAEFRTAFPQAAFVAETPQ